MANHQRILEFENGFNFRDLGGYRTTNCKSLKWNNLVRSAHVSHFTHAEKRTLYGYAIRTIIDLPSRSEAAL